MLRCSKECDPGKNNFTFSNRSATFQEAQNLCKQNKKVLAQNLDGFSYAKLLRCCTGHRGTYWIGLKNVAAINCENSDEPGFQWIGKKTCSDGSPLELGHAQHLNNNECKAVTIETRRSDNNPNVPRARVENCNDRNFNYICQAAKQNRNSKTVTITKPTTTILTREIKTSTENQITTVFTPTTKVNSKHLKNIFAKNCKISTDSSSLKVGGFIGGAVGFNVLVFLLLIILFRIKKKSSKENTQNYQATIYVVTHMIKQALQFIAGRFSLNLFFINNF